MSLVRWDPFANLDDMFARMPNLLGRWPRLSGHGGEGAVEWAPTVDISETDAEYMLKAQLPAVKREDGTATGSIFFDAIQYRSSRAHARLPHTVVGGRTAGDHSGRSYEINWYHVEIITQ